MFSIFRWLKYCFTKNRNNVKGKILLVGPRMGGKSTLLEAAKAAETENTNFHCRDESEYEHTAVNHRDRWGNGLFEFSIFETKFVFYVPGDWGGDTEYQCQLVNMHLDDTRTIFYCFDVNNMFAGWRYGYEEQSEQFSTAEYTMGFIRFLLDRMENGPKEEGQDKQPSEKKPSKATDRREKQTSERNRKKKNISVKNIIFVGTHTDLLNGYTSDEIKRKAIQDLNFNELKKEIKLRFPKLNVCLVCGSLLDYKNSTEFWVAIAKEIQRECGN